ncbi:hypothetical protein E8E13_007555 [Curvularia kusanoi]|uniref:Uncharacterized protein n=1 Tax=Curvularia kusanoi TaxID=90978 RepID=A0A9P4WDC4_CURKU|nr:hypothetical protein E8E13_007555 [Curvularia kusanoi]
MEDRSFMVPQHAGRNVFPNTPLFSRLLRYANRAPARIAIDDVRSKHQRTHLELLSDVLGLRRTVSNALDAATLGALRRREEVYIAIVAAGGYEYTVAMLAVLALGAAAVPISPALPVEEMAYFIDKSRSALVLVSSFDLKKCCELEKRIASTSNEHFRGVPIGSCIYTPVLNPSDILISSDRALEENSPAIVIFTSGTTGPPKGAVMRRSFIFDCALSVADHYRLAEDDVMLHVLPVHHATGVGINFFPFLISGSRIEFRSGGFDERYGATEFGAIFKVRLDDKRVPEGSVGQIANGVDVKLSEGDEGEVLVKSPHMFSKYLQDPEATAKAHDEEGYFRTGDIARREGSYYYIIGRASLDIIKSGGYKISALDVERELLGLPYISEAMVVGVADEEFGQRVAALVSLQEEELSDAFLATYGNTEHILTIEDVRRDLRERLAGYKMPTLLRIASGELPKTVTGKVQKKLLGPRFFPHNYELCSEVQRWMTPSINLAKL